MVSSIHTNSRLVDIGRDGKMTYVQGEYGFDESLYPYMGFSGNDDKAAVIYSDTTPQIINIPSVYRNYTFANEGNDRDLQNLDVSVSDRVTKIGPVEDIHDAKYHVESHSISKNGLVFIRLPDEADGSTITYDRSSNGKVRLLYLDDDILSYDFSEFGDFRNLGSFSYERNLPITGDITTPVIFSDIPSHHFVEGVDFIATVTSIGMNDLHLCKSDGTRYATVPETVEYQQQLPERTGSFQKSGEIFKVWKLYNFKSETRQSANYEQFHNANNAIRGHFNMLENDPYGGDMDAITVLSGQDHYEGDLTYCRNGAGNDGKGYMITHPFSQINTAAISYMITPQVLDFNKNPIANLTSWLGFSHIGSGERIIGVTGNTYLVVESDDDPTQIRIKYDIRAGHVDQVRHEETNPFYITAQRTFGNAGVSFEGDGLTVTGAGRVLFQIDSDVPVNVANVMSVNGSLSEGTTLRLVESPYDLVKIPHNSNGFIIDRFYHRSGPAQINVLAGSLDDSDKSAPFRYNLEAEYVIYHGRCCKGKYTVDYSKQISGISRDLQISDKDGYKEITGVNIRTVGLPDDWLPHGGKTFRINQHETTNNFAYSIYDQLPAKSDGSEFTGVFSKDFNIPSGDNVYLVIDSDGGTSTLGNIAPPQLSMKITGLSATTNPDGTKPLGIPYHLERDGIRIKSGIVLDRISTEIAHYGPSSNTDAKLYLYHDALVTELDGGKVIYFDGKNNEIVSDGASGDPYIYNPFAYVKMPLFTTPVNITEIELRSTTDEFEEYVSMRLPYLDNENQEIFTEKFIPVVPGFQEVSMLVNGTNVIMKIEDVTRDSEITVIPERTVGKVSYAYGPADADAVTSTSASFAAKESGEIYVIYDVTFEGNVEYSISSRTLSVKTTSHSIGGPGHLAPTGGGGLHFTPSSATAAKLPVSVPGVSKGQYGDNFIKSLEKNQLSEMTLSADIIINGVHRETLELLSSGDISPGASRSANTVSAVFEPRHDKNIFSIDVDAGDFVEIIMTGRISVTGTTDTTTDTRISQRPSTYFEHAVPGETHRGTLHFEKTVRELSNTVSVAAGTLVFGPGTMTITS